ncbi:hypothetical protein NLI96_g7857 [Meripilus lineatus]|uniref:Uncharacterized protein n=1 Tax=Meripilus lineatus TaxID=2056292 RepID=A0AAD5V327_9APHY|nr:hypothetical protein NLI96_g7857 [Physisporinus lineatus]
MLMHMVLIAADLWDVVGPEVVPFGPKESKVVQAFEKKKQLAMSKIVLSLTPSQLSFIAGLENPHEIWKKIKSLHRSLSINSILSLYCHFLHISKSPTKTVIDWITQVQAATFELENTPYPVSDLDPILVLTDSLSLKYEALRTVLDTLPITDLIPHNVIIRIQSHETLLDLYREKTAAQVQSGSTDSALVAVYRKRGGDQGARNVVCYRYGRQDHYQLVCLSPSVSHSSQFSGHGSTSCNSSPLFAGHVQDINLDNTPVDTTYAF